VGGDVDDRVTSSQEVNTRLARETADFPKRYPGVTVNPGGEFQDTQESVSSLGFSFLVGFIINFMLLASMFRSMLKPLIILAAIPFSFIGVIFAFILHNEPLSFLAIMGVVGLSGVVVNDSIVLVDYANQLSAERPAENLLDLVVEATSTRLRAVLLTTITTVLGLLPTAYGIGGYDPFLVPMALSFAWGLAVATFLTLLLVPVLYYLVGRRKHGRTLQAG
jgi:multidrug efflux pump subunit AcrB